MAEVSVHELQPPKNLLEMQLEAVRNEALIAHDRFEEHWQINPLAKISTPSGEISPSFHNRKNHIGPVVEAAELFCWALEEGRDPFNIRGQIEQYNREQHEEIMLEDFILATEYIFAPGHDIGNLTGNGELAGDEVEFADKYLREDAEDRSISIMRTLFNKHVNLLTVEGKEKAERIIKLGAYLIDLTKFSMDKTVSARAFWDWVQWIDQIGTYYTTEVAYPDMVVGLMNEWRVRDEKPQNLRDWIEFGIKHCVALVPDEKQREQVLAVIDPTGEKTKTIADTIKKMKQRIGNIDRPTNWREDISLLLQTAE